jgi:hypothetical protein
VRHILLTVRTRREEEASRKDRWQPSAQLMSVLDPSGDIMRREGLESRVEVVSIRIEAVMVDCDGCCGCDADPANNVEELQVYAP